MKRAENNRKGQRAGAVSPGDTAAGRSITPVGYSPNAVGFDQPTMPALSAASSYQGRKARAIAAVLIAAAVSADTPLSQAAAAFARMSEREWISVSLAAKVPVADTPARVLAIAYLISLSA